MTHQVTAALVIWNDFSTSASLMTVSLGGTYAGRFEPFECASSMDHDLSRDGGRLNYRKLRRDLYEREGEKLLEGSSHIVHGLLVGDPIERKADGSG